MKKIGITGYKGRLGSYLLGNFPNYVPLDCDVTNPEDVENCIRDAQVDKVLHLAAKSDVEFCEKPENEKVVADVNLRGTFNVCRAAELVGISVVLLSTDHVFSGTRGRYKEKDKPSPVNFYGMSKFAAEGLQKSFDNLSIVRTSYLFDSQRLSNQLNKLWHEEHTEYPTFIIRSFMYLPHFSQALNEYLCKEGMPKILHLSGNTSTSWYGFMDDIAWICGDGKHHQKFVHSRQTQIYDMSPRPFWGGLDVRLSKKLGFRQYSYLDGIREMEKHL